MERGPAGPRLVVMTTVRAAVVAVPRGTAAQWVDDVRRWADAGFTALLVPDTLWTTSTFPALAAAAVVPDIHLRSWVSPATLRTTGALVREITALQQLSAGRFELGIGPGRPEAENDARRLGAGWGTPGERVRAVAAVVPAVRALDAAPPVVIAAAGPRMLALASEIADRVGLALPHTADENLLAATSRQVREARSLPLSFQVVGVNDVLPPWVTRHLAGVDLGSAAGILRGDPTTMAAVLTDRAERLGIDEVVVPAELVDVFRPILDVLRRA